MSSSAKAKIAEAFSYIENGAHVGVENIYHQDCCICIAKPFGQTERRLGTRELLALKDAYRRAFPKFRFEVDTLIEEGDTVVARWSVIAEPSREFIEPMTQTPVRPETDQIKVEGISFCRLREGRVIETFQLQDDLGMLMQLGVDPGALPVVEFRTDSTVLERPPGKGAESPHKQLMREFMAQAVNEKDEARREAAAKRFIVPDMQLFGPDAGNVDAGLAGIEKFTGGHRKYRRAFPDFEFVVLDMVEEGDHVAMRWAVADAWHSGPLQFGETQLLPTGNNANVHGAAICEIRDGKIVSIWQLTDSASLLRQLMS